MTQTHRKGMHAEEIKAALKMRFGSLAAFAVKLGRNEGAVSRAINTPGYSRRVEAEIAKVLCKPVHEIWPSRYDVSGEPLSYSVSALSMSRRHAGQRSNGVAA
ncbi:MAG: helix-turn-helix domain-containing protein [Acetobacter sp.]|uniref:helix-turn-helix domain-containing protein n=1 Tax=Acetobacter sp. TaxID=440 RepID=UPI0039ED850C